MRQVSRALVPLLLALFLIAVALPGSAATIAPPANLGELARISSSVVLAEAMDSHSEPRGEIPYTLTTFRVVRNVAGQEAGRTLILETPGGVVGEQGFRAPGEPRFAKGGRYLLFLDPAPSGDWRLKMASYGLLREVPGTGLLQPVAEAGELDVLPRPGVEAIGTYRERDLLPQLTAAHGGAPWHRQASEATAADLTRLAETKATGDVTAANPPGVSVTNAPAACRYVAADPNPASGTPDLTPVRWFGFETGTTVSYWSTTPGQVGISDGGASAVQNGAAAWTNHNTSVVNLLYAGSKASSANCSTNNGYVLGEVTFNDPCNQLPPLAVCTGTVPAGWTSTTCCGKVAEYVYSYNAAQTLGHDGNNWHPLNGVALLVNDGSQCLGETDFQEMMTHFLGHAVGFEHHMDTDATMYQSLGVHPSRGAAISTTDKACASFDYHTFLDVPYTYFAWRFIEAVRIAGVMADCGGANFCPNDVVTRGSMALLLLKAKEGAGYVPPPCTTASFNDLPCSDPLAPWVEELVRRGVTAGCGNGNYCPTNPVTRNQMAVFLIKTVEGPSYVPPACTTDPFADVPCSSPFAPWVKLLTDRGITAGCGGGNYCPNNTVVKAQMAVFSTVNFHIPLP
jgi:hypothetical protein